MKRLVLVLALIAPVIAVARPGPQWADTAPNIRQWFQSLMRPDMPYMSCCGEADGFEADYFEVKDNKAIVTITDGRGIIPDGTKVEVPPEKLKWDAGNPTGHGWLFIGAATGGAPLVYCYVTPGGV